MVQMYVVVCTNSYVRQYGSLAFTKGEGNLRPEEGKYRAPQGGKKESADNEASLDPVWQ